MSRIIPKLTVIPAKAVIQLSTGSFVAKLDSWLRGNDGLKINYAEFAA